MSACQDAVARFRHRAIADGHTTKAEVEALWRSKIGLAGEANENLRAWCRDALDAVDTSQSNPNRLKNVKVHERDAREDPPARPDLAAETVIVRDEHDREQERQLRRRLGLGG